MEFLFPGIGSSQNIVNGGDGDLRSHERGQERQLVQQQLQMSTKQMTNCLTFDTFVKDFYNSPDFSSHTDRTNCKVYGQS